MAGPRQVIARAGDFQIVLMDSISYANEHDKGVFAVSGSHGGKSSGEITGQLPVAGAIFNDAGVGKDQAGVAGLAAMDRKGIPAAAVSYESARIGDSQDTWHNGIISHVNAKGADAGLKVGMRVEDALRGWIDSKTRT
jgi:hypothetical protein